MTETRRAFLAVLLARGVWRSSVDAESQVAHWTVEGLASLPELRAARRRTKDAKRALTDAQDHYRASCAEALMGNMGQKVG